MSDLARTHWVGDGCVPPHSTEPAVLPPISDSTVTPVASEGTMRLRRERDEARAEVERLRAAVQAVRDLASDEGRWMYGKPMVENHFGPDFLDGYGYAMSDVLAALGGERNE